MVDDPYPVARPDLGRPLEELDQAERSPSSETGQPPSNPTRDGLRLVGSLLRPGDELEDVVGRRLVRSSIVLPSEERPQRLSSIE